MEPDETALMDADAINDEKSAVSSSEINPSVPVPDVKSSETISDLEEGEIED